MKNNVAEKIRPMYIGIEKETRIGDIQKEFNLHYPYLKLEFYKSFPTQIKLSRKPEKIGPDATVERVTQFYKPGSICLDHSSTVSRVVNDLWEDFGLSAFVFRKSGNTWIETSLTDNWTLEKQNNIGESFALPDGNKMGD
jgi:hypothetical protein